MRQIRFRESRFAGGPAYQERAVVGMVRFFRGAASIGFPTIQSAHGSIQIRLVASWGPAFRGIDFPIGGDLFQFASRRRPGPQRRRDRRTYFRPGRPNRPRPIDDSSSATDVRREQSQSADSVDQTADSVDYTTETPTSPLSLNFNRGFIAQFEFTIKLRGR